MLAGSLGIFRHTVLSRKKMLEEEPLLRREGLTGGFRYFDCLTNDARLTLATVRSATKKGAIAVNYVEASVCSGTATAWPASASATAWLDGRALSGRGWSSTRPDPGTTACARWRA